MSEHSNGIKKKVLARIKSSIFERTLSVAKIGLNSGIKYAAQKTLGNDKAKFYSDQAEYITKELGQLKGSLMKAGQMLSMYGEYFFPPEANAILKQLQSDSPALDWISMKPHIESLMSPELLDLLEIEPVAIGTASMGQVHVARIKSTGEKIALKIQYPGVDKAIDSDIRALKKLLQISKIIPSSIDLNPVMAEIKLMLLQELDYNLEANHTERYAQLVSELTDHQQRFKVPKVFRQFSSEKVLATEYLEGLKADHPMVQALSQQRRNRLAENFLELYQTEIFKWNFIQTDPHLGNYKIQIDSNGHDRLALLDFGATKEFPIAFMSVYRKMVRGAIIGDEELFSSGAKGLGFITETDSEAYIQAFTNFCFQTVEPFFLPEDPRNKDNKVNASGEYHWKQTDLPSRVVKNAIQFKNFDLRTPPQDIIFLDRKTGGVFIFLSVLHAHINGRKIVEPFLKQT
jgi:predicted unusual protein kinase regulating ubiquinone biosynthesis (AarF/ABC1/UbiB family)